MSGSYRAHPSARILAAVVALTMLAFATPTHGAAGSDVANVQFEATIPAPVYALAASADGTNVLVVDDEARFTFIPDQGADEQAWTAPTRGLLSDVEASLGESTPTPVGASVTPDGSYWVGAVSYEGAARGAVFGFSHWSDEPIWTYDIPEGDDANDANQATSVASGGPYHAVGTEGGTVYVFDAAGTGGSDISPRRVYTQDNLGTPFSFIHDVALSGDGKRTLIATDNSGTPALHVFSDIFFQASFKRIESPVYRAEVSHDGTRGAAITGTDATTRLHFLDMDAGRTIWETTIGSDVRSIALSDDGTYLAIGTEGGRVALYEERGRLNDREPVREWHLSSAVTAVTLSSDGGALAATTQGGDLHFLSPLRDEILWSYEAGQPVIGGAIGNDAENLVIATAASEDGRVVYTKAAHTMDHVVAPEPRLAPGVVNTIPVELANTGNRMQTIQVTWGDLPTGWEGAQDNLTLAPGEQATLKARISVPKAQAPNLYTLPFTLDMGHAREPITLKARVPDVTSGRATVTWEVNAAVPDGAPAAFVITIENTGNTANEATIGYAKLPAGWEAQFTGGTGFRLQAGEDRKVALKVWAPANAPLDREAWFDVIIAWQHGEERIPLTVHVVDGPTYRGLLDSQAPLGPDGNDGTAPLLTELQTAADAGPGKKARESKDSPAPGVVVLLAGLAAGLVALQRRRRT